jgi:hypothetical protein
MDLYGIAASAWPPNQPVHSPRWYFATLTILFSYLVGSLAGTSIYYYYVAGGF